MPGKSTSSCGRNDCGTLIFGKRHGQRFLIGTVGTLYLVATPIGNLEDITLRALRILRSVGLVAAEDTRATRKLFSRYDIRTPLTSYFEHNKLAKLDLILATLREKDVAVVSEAGMPGISDPGYELVRAAINAGLKVVPIPGPSAVIAALAASGLPTDQFVYVGFLPRRGAERRRSLEKLRSESRTIVAFEAPHRVAESLKDIESILGNRDVAVARELTKLHEEVVRGSVEEVLQHFAIHQPRGEFTLVISGASASAAAADLEEVKRRLHELVEQGMTDKEAIGRLAKETGLPRRQLYRLWVEGKQGSQATNPVAK
ncbi:MAG: 16S rRNA (cytidine(1402)-2'-O)-methyltransferase [Chloroflexi bacterium]|nr:16S rRNA (cytidine(1402)-2'-O)-methyltransferase [Chloroflexota bacterium]